MACIEHNVLQVEYNSSISFAEVPKSGTRPWPLVGRSKALRQVQLHRLQTYPDRRRVPTKNASFGTRLHDIM